MLDRSLIGSELPTSMFIVPPPFAEESLYGYVNHAIHINPAAPKAVSTWLIDRHTILAPFGSPNIAHICEATRGVLGSALQIVERHTLWPAMRLFCNLQTYNDALLQAATTFGPGAARCPLGRRHASGLRNAFCTECSIEQERNSGIAFWTRAFQAPFVEVCAAHQQALTAGCGRCRFSQVGATGAMLPADTCWCGQTLRPLAPAAETTRTLQSISRIGDLLQRLLTCKLPTMGEESLTQFYRGALKRRGLVQAGKLNRMALIEDLRATFGEGYLKRNGIPLDYRATRIWRAWQSKGWTNDILVHILMAVHLFDSNEEFLLDYDAFNEARTLTPVASSSCPANIPNDSDRLHFREWLLRELAADPQLNRSNLRIGSRAKLRAWLNRHDSEWFDKTLPQRKRQPHSFAAELRQRQERNDTRLAALIQKRYLDLFSVVGPPKQITRRYLLGGLPGGVYALENPAARPKAMQLANKLVEQRAEFCARCVRWALTHPNHFCSREALVIYLMARGIANRTEAHRLITGGEIDTSGRCMPIRNAHSHDMNTTDTGAHST
jgi:hypothetical protein